METDRSGRRGRAPAERVSSVTVQLLRKTHLKQIDRETLRARYRWRKRRYAPPASRVASASSASGGAMGVGTAG